MGDRVLWGALGTFFGVKTMQAIRTRYYGPSNVRGSRIIAKCEAGSIVMAYNHALGIWENHATAAAMLLEKLGWGKPYAGGCFGDDYYWTAVVINEAWNDTLARDFTQAAKRHAQAVEVAA